MQTPKTNQRKSIRRCTDIVLLFAFLIARKETDRATEEQGAPGTSARWRRPVIDSDSTMRIEREK